MHRVACQDYLLKSLPMRRTSRENKTDLVTHIILKRLLPHTDACGVDEVALGPLNVIGRSYIIYY